MRDSGKLQSINEKTKNDNNKNHDGDGDNEASYRAALVHLSRVLVSCFAALCIVSTLTPIH